MRWHESEENNTESTKDEEVKEKSNEDFTCALERLWEKLQ